EDILTVENALRFSTLRTPSIRVFARCLRLRHTCRLRGPSPFLAESSYDPLPDPSSALLHRAPRPVFLGSLGNHQPVRLQPQAGPQQAGVLRAAARLAERPGGTRPRVRPDRPAAAGGRG